MGSPVKPKLKTITQWPALLFFSALINFNFCLGQNLGGSLKIDLGYSVTQFKDTRHSSIFRNGHGVNAGLQYRIQGKKSANTLAFRITHTSAESNNDFISSAFAPETQIFYEHLRTLKNKDWQVGAFVDHGTFSTNRDGGGWYDFNDYPSLSYLIWSSVGISGTYDRSLGKKWRLKVRGILPILAFTERPPFSFAFPEDQYTWDSYFLLFKPAYFKRAQFRTFTQFTNLQVNTGFQRRIGKRGNQVGINYQWSYLFSDGPKPLFRFNHFLDLSFQLNFKKS